VQPRLHLVLEPRLVAQAARRLGPRPELGDRAERRPLVVRVGAHGLDELRDEVVAPRELHVDVAPGGAHLVAVPDQAIEGQHAPQDEPGKQHDQEHL
jgi:hypothetical protein